MRVFVTGATGFIGSAIVPELLRAGHQVLGLTRSDAGAEALMAAGAEPHRGDLRDVESLRSGAQQADGVIHCAFIHDFSSMERFRENCAVDKSAIEAIGEVLAGSERPFVISGGLGGWAPGVPVTEEMDPPAGSPMPRVSETFGMSLLEKGVNVSMMRLPQVHDPVKQGLVTYLVAIARAKGVSAYVGEGRNRWAAAHVKDVATLYRLAMEKAEPGAKYHAVDEEGVPVREIAEALGRGLKLPVVSIAPEEAMAHYGFLGSFATHDLVATSAITREKLGWKPNGPTLIEDLNQMHY